MSLLLDYVNDIAYRDIPSYLNQIKQKLVHLLLFIILSDDISKYDTSQSKQINQPNYSGD